MINVFEKHEPEYQRIVRRLALDIWKNSDSKDAYESFYRRVQSYKIKYERDLTKYYREKNIKIYVGTIQAKANQWEKDQSYIVESLQAISTIKKENIKEELINEYIETKSPRVQRLLSDLYLTKKEKKKGVEVLQVYSFKDNLEAKARQIGSQAAYDLGAEINHAVITQSYDSYDWNTQNDSLVRRTHKKLHKKTFLYSDHPTTVDKYGNRHQGPPGTDWGCRCWESPPTGKPLRNYVVVESKSGTVTESWDRAA